jgi:hypothetical protein
MSPSRAVLALHLMSAWFVATAILIHHSGAAFAIGGSALAAGIVAAIMWSLLRLPADGPLAPEPELSRT